MKKTIAWVCVAIVGVELVLAALVLIGLALAPRRSSDFGGLRERLESDRETLGEPLTTTDIIGYLWKPGYSYQSEWDPSRRAGSINFIISAYHGPLESMWVYSLEDREDVVAVASMWSENGRPRCETYVYRADDFAAIQAELIRVRVPEAAESP